MLSPAEKSVESVEYVSDVLMRIPLASAQGERRRPSQRFIALEVVHVTQNNWLRSSSHNDIDRTIPDTYGVYVFNSFGPNTRGFLKCVKVAGQVPVDVYSSRFKRCIDIRC